MTIGRHICSKSMRYNYVFLILYNKIGAGTIYRNEISRISHLYNNGVILFKYATIEFCEKHLNLTLQNLMSVKIIIIVNENKNKYF